MDNLRKNKCLSCNKEHLDKLNEEREFKSRLKFSNNDINTFILLLRRGVFPYEYTNDCEKFNETTLPEKVKKYIVA